MDNTTDKKAHYRMFSVIRQKGNKTKGIPLHSDLNAGGDAEKLACVYSAGGAVK